jgi:hypothetical protein
MDRKRARNFVREMQGSEVKVEAVVLQYLQNLREFREFLNGEDHKSSGGSQDSYILNILPKLLLR